MDSPLAGRHVLLLEDELMVLFMMEEMLADLGCSSVAAAATVDQALALLEERSFDAAVLDVNLGGHKSYPVADALAARCIPFIFATGYGDHGLSGGYRDRPVLKKPFAHGALSAALSQLMAD